MRIFLRWKEKLVAVVLVIVLEYKVLYLRKVFNKLFTHCISQFHVCQENEGTNDSKTLLHVDRLRAVLLYSSDHARKAMAKLCKLEKWTRRDWGEGGKSSYQSKSCRRRQTRRSKEYVGQYVHCLGKNVQWNTYIAWEGAAPGFLFSSPLSHSDRGTKDCHFCRKRFISVVWLTDN